MVKLSREGDTLFISNGSEELRLTRAEFLELSQSLRLVMDQLLHDDQRKGGPIPVFVVPVSGVVLGSDSLKTAVHLQLSDHQGNTTRFALSPSLARLLVERLPDRIA
ncbi:MAG: hypothetical protein E5X60_35455, partial [Mesorhizobium sp.]